MWEIPVFAAEREAGLSDVVRSTGRLTYAAVAEPCPVFDISQAVAGKLVQSPYGYCPTCKAPGVERERRPDGNDKCQGGHTYPSKSAQSDVPVGRAKATNEGQFDLFYLKTLLVSTGWNLNDDVFDLGEVWAARKTPEDKQFNYEHDCKDIIGHITDTHVVDVEGKALADDLVADDLPPKFHVVTNAVLYRYWADKDLQKRMDTIVAEVAEGKWFVSMEALFRGFDYAVVRADNTTSIIARNQETAFLTKHLRAYGGTGTFNNMKVGRLMRNITFSGKGLVRKPANPESIIFSDTESFTATVGKFSQLEMESGYGTVSDDPSQTKESKSMAVELEVLNKQVEALKADNEKLQAELRDSNVKAVTAAKVKLEADLKVAQEAIEKLQADNKAATAALAKVEAEKAEVAKTLNETQASLATIQAAQQKAARVATAKEKLGIADDKANKLVESLASLSDEQFQANIQTQADYLEEVKSAAVKSTPAPLPPTSTPAPVAMGFPNKVKTLATAAAVETDSADANANPAVLETATPASEPALATGSTDDGVETTRASIADFLMSGYMSGGKTK
ncbi:MAG: hypothetical protein K2R98_19465 [Gemmataceae bacterium]|nr:hypothetical protein [Gemmataceae bacterium]